MSFTIYVSLSLYLFLGLHTLAREARPGMLACAAPPVTSLTMNGKLEIAKQKKKEKEQQQAQPMGSAVQSRGILSTSRGPEALDYAVTFRRKSKHLAHVRSEHTHEAKDGVLLPFHRNGQANLEVSGTLWDSLGLSWTLRDSLGFSGSF